MHSSKNIFSNLENYKKSIALVEKEKKITYEELIRNSYKFENFFKKKSLVLILCKNNIDTITAYIATVRSGSVAMLINDSLNINLIKKIIIDYNPEYLFSNKNHQICKLFKKECLNFKSSCLRKSIKKINYKINSQLSLLLSTSGTTGSSKHVRISQLNLISNTEAIIKSLKVKKKDITVTTLPLNYSYGMSIINTHLNRGSTIILNEESILKRNFWSLLKKNKVTSFGAVPFLIEAIVKFKLFKYFNKHLTYITQAGGALDVLIKKKFIDICNFKKIKFITMYGTTEASPRVSCLPWKYLISKTNSIGIPIKECKIFIVNENGNKIKESNKVGEIYIKGKNICLGYANTYKDLKKGNENNFLFKTGDLGMFDADGFFYITGRKKRIIKLYGHRVNLDDIEKLLKQNNIENICWGKDDKLYIFVKSFKSKKIIIKLMKYETSINVNNYKIYKLKFFPKNSSGKITYNELEKLIL